MPTRTGRFGRSDRVLRSVDYRRVSRKGKRFRSREFLVLVAPAWPAHPSIDRDAPTRRLGVTVSRRVGNAVARNHVKRRIREWYRSRRDSLAEDTDIVVIAHPGAAQLGAEEIARSLDQALRQPGGGRPKRDRNKTPRHAGDAATGKNKDG